VLIHAAASPFGLAAVAVAFQLSVEIFASVIGPDSGKQREVLEGLGVKKAHIVNADSDSFAAVICEHLGKGVDLVYNPTQNHKATNFQCVRPGKFSPSSRNLYVSNSL
jgi:NADPH:quinone reductase-like Zn-dependent oxidoreductase